MLWWFHEGKDMDIHDGLKYLREQLNLTTRAFGASINMSYGAITNMEKGMRMLPNAPFAMYDKQKQE